MKILGKIGFYFLLFFISFLFFLYFMLPTDGIRQKVIAAAGPVLGADAELKIEKLETYRLTGLAMEGVTLFRKIGGKPVPVIQIDELTARAGLFSLLFGSPQVAFALEAGDFEASGTVENKEEHWLVTLSFDELDLGAFPYIAKVLGVKGVSDIDGELQLDYNPKEPLNPVGDLSLTFNRLALKKGKAEISGTTLELPDLSLASKNSILKAMVEKGYLNIETLRLDGKDFSVSVEGRVFMARTFDKYRLKLEGGFEIPAATWKTVTEIATAAGKGEVVRQMGVDENTAAIVVRDGVGIFKEKLDQERKTGDRYPVKIAGFLLSPQVYAGETKLWPFDIKSFLK